MSVIFGNATYVIRYDKPTIKDQVLCFICGTSAIKALGGGWHITCSMTYGANSLSEKGKFSVGQETWGIWGTLRRSGGVFLGLDFLI